VRRRKKEEGRQKIGWNRKNGRKEA